MVASAATRIVSIVTSVVLSLKGPNSKWIVYCSVEGIMYNVH